MAWTTSPRVVALRQRHRIVDVVVEMLDGWRRHVAGRNAAMLTYYAFLSIFPLLMVATTILGWVLEDNPELQEDILDSALAQIPVLGTQLRENVGSLTGDVPTLVVGLLIALWASTKAFVAVQHGLDDAWEVPIDDRDNLAVRRGKALIGIVIIGASLIGATALTSVASVAELPAGGRVLLTLGTLALNSGVLFGMYRLLSAATVTSAMSWPGALLGGTGFTLLQVLGVQIVQRYLADASDTYGAFGSVLALLAWLSLHATLSIAGAELNAAIVRVRGGRAAEPPAPADAADSAGDDAGELDRS